MKLVASLLVVLVMLFCSCARRSELEGAKAELAEAQHKIDSLESERVPRVQYDVTRASLKLADDRISILERELKEAQEKLAVAQQVAMNNVVAHPQASSAPSDSSTYTSLKVSKGEYVVSNDTFVFSPDAQLDFGPHLQITSPTGLLVTDPDQRVVGGDLSIKAKGMTMETTDGLLSAQGDGSVQFVGNTLTMRFNGNSAAPAAPTETPPSKNDLSAAGSASGTEPAPAAAANAP